MARNEEKQLGRLNRMWLQQLDEEKLNKAPPRPGLGSLHTAAELKKWLPSIKRDIDFCLKQSQVTCYPERQIEEFSTKIEQLTREYKAYVRKIRDLEPGITAVPWTDRAYSRKRKLQEDRTEPEDSESSDANTDKDEPKLTQISAPILENKDTDNLQPKFDLISAPILEKDDTYTKLYGFEEPVDIVYNTDRDKQDLPLEFNNKSSDQCCDKNYLRYMQNHGSAQYCDNKLTSKCLRNQLNSKSVKEHEYKDSLCQDNRDLIENALDSHKGNTDTVTLNCDRLTSEVTGESKMLDEHKNIKCSCRRTIYDSKILNPVALRTAKTPWSFGCSECNRVKDDTRHSTVPICNNCSLTCDSQKCVGNVIQSDKEMKESEVNNSKQLLTLNLPYSDSSEEDS